MSAAPGAVRHMQTSFRCASPTYRSGSEKAIPLGESGVAVNGTGKSRLKEFFNNAHPHHTRRGLVCSICQPFLRPMGWGLA